MSRTLGRTAEDVKSMSIAKALVAVLERVEMANCDPEDIFDASAMVAASFFVTHCKFSDAQLKELRLALAALKMVYCGGPAPDALRQLCAYHVASQEEVVS